MSDPVTPPASYPWHTAGDEGSPMMTEAPPPTGGSWNGADVGPPLPKPPPETPAKMPHPTDYLPNDGSLHNLNLKMWGNLDRGQAPVGGAPQDYRSSLKGVHPLLPFLFTNLAKYLGLPSYTAPGPYGHTPAYQPGQQEGVTPYLTQASQAAEAARLGHAGGAQGGSAALLSALLQQSGQQGMLPPGLLPMPQAGPY